MSIRPIVFIFLTGASAVLIHCVLTLHKRRRWFRGLPGPPHSFLWGHLKAMGEAAALLPPNCHPQAYIASLVHHYDLKGIFYLDLWPLADGQVILTDPDLMNQVTVEKSLDMHPMANEFLSPIVGPNAIAVSNGAVWKKSHNAMLPAFSWSHIRSLTVVMVEECLRFRETVDRFAATGEVFSMEAEAAKLIFDVMSRVVFNYSLKSQTTGSQTMEDLHAMVKLVEARLSFNPFRRLWAFLTRHLVLRRLDKEISLKINERLDVLRQEEIVPSRKDPLSILDLMLREHLQHEVNKGIVAAISPSDMKQLVTDVKALLLGGHGTSTDTICYIYMLLSKHPAALQKLREEHTRVFAPSTDATISILLSAPQKLNELEFTAAVIKETLRLFPVGFGLRIAEPGASLTYQGRRYPIDNGIAVISDHHAMHYDPQYHPDPDKFKPERFLNDAVPRSHFRTFGRGPRACLGQNLAQDELKVILLLTVRDWEFECAGLKPNPNPRVSYSDLDTVFGDIVFQELALEAKPRGGMMMTAKRLA